jgi:PAS domain S-box-containing protein
METVLSIIESPQSARTVYAPDPAERLSEAIKAGRRHWAWETDPEGCFTYCSSDFERITGYPLCHIVGRSLAAMIDAGNVDREVRAQQLQTLAQHAPFHEFIYRLENAQHRQVYLSSSGTPMFGADGAFLGYRGLSSDTTDEYVVRHQARAALTALRESERRGRALLDGTGGYLVMLMPDGLILDMNRMALTSLFEERETVVGGHFMDLAWFRGVPGSRAAVEASLAAASVGKSHNCELAINDLEKGRRLVDFIFNPVTVTKTRSGFIVVDGRDITERRAVEERSRGLEVQLMQSHKMESLGTLAGGIAHEINTPIQYVGDNMKFLGQAFEAMTVALAAYGGLARAIEAHTDGTAALAHAKEVLAANDFDFLLREIPPALKQTGEGVDHVRQIVSAVKEFSHPDRKEITPEDLGAAIKTTATVSRNQWKYVADIEYDLDPSLPPVPCQIGKINQVLLNLIVNAAQAIEEAKRPERGLIRVSTRKSGKWAEIRVSDNGAGIKPEHQARIFDLFFTTKPPGRGTGQGLAICHSIVTRDHGGTIAFESQSGIGTTFIMRLPLENRKMDA